MARIFSLLLMASCIQVLSDDKLPTFEEVRAIWFAEKSALPKIPETLETKEHFRLQADRLNVDIESIVRNASRNAELLHFMDGSVAIEIDKKHDFDFFVWAYVIARW